MASIRKRGNNYFIDYRIDGKRVRQSVGPSKEEANKVLKDIEARFESGSTQQRQLSRLISELLAEFTDYSQSAHSPNTQKRYNGIINNFIRFLKRQYPHILNLSALNAEHLKAYTTFRINEQAKPNTINSEIVVLRKIFKLAIKWGYTTSNPAEDIAKIIVEDKPLPRILTTGECQKILDASEAWFYPIVFTFLNTGLRKGELENLLWDDVDLDNRTIHVCVRDQWTPKSNERTIPINQKLHDVLSQLRLDNHSSDYVFTDTKQRPLDPNKIRISLLKVAKEAGLSDISKVSTLRYTFISRLVQSGVDLRIITKLVGQSEINTALLYKQFEKRHMDDAVEKLNFDE